MNTDRYIFTKVYLSHILKLNNILQDLGSGIDVQLLARNFILDAD